MKHTDEEIAAMTPDERSSIRRRLSRIAMSDAIAMHGGGNLSKRAKREHDRMMRASFAEFARYHEPPPPPNRRKGLQDKIACAKNILPLANRSQQKKITQQIVSMEAELAALEVDEANHGTGVLRDADGNACLDP